MQFPENESWKFAVYFVNATLASYVSPNSHSNLLKGAQACFQWRKERKNEKMRTEMKHVRINYLLWSNDFCSNKVLFTWCLPCQYDPAGDHNVGSWLRRREKLCLLIEYHKSNSRNLRETSYRLAWHSTASRWTPLPAILNYRLNTRRWLWWCE